MVKGSWKPSQMVKGLFDLVVVADISNSMVMPQSRQRYVTSIRHWLVASSFIVSLLGCIWSCWDDWNAHTLGTLVDLIRLEGLVKLEMDCYLSYFSLARLLSHSSFSFAQQVEFDFFFFLLWIKKNPFCHLELTCFFLDFIFASFCLSFYTGQDYLLCA